MSSDPLPASLPPPDLPSADQTAPPASLKPLLNPLQTDSPALSTVAEPPRSPNPQNAATDHAGNNVDLDLPSASNSVVGPGETIGEEQPISAVTQNGNGPAGSYPPLPSVDSPAVAPVSREDTAPPPLPTDAPVPPTPPQPIDEPQPTLPEGAIPPAVSTPTVITTETPAAPEPTPALETAPSAQLNGVPTTPAAAPGLDEAIAPATASEPAGAPLAPGSTQEGMEVDPPAQSSPAGVDSRASEVSLKRAGDDDLEGRDEKRVKEESAAPSSANANASAQTPIPVTEAAPIESKPAAETPAPVAPGLILDPNAPPPPWITYVDPPARPSGPTTPLTPTQHKHLLASVRSLKKNKDAGFFHSPVDVVLFGIPHYAQIITKPMDLTTVEQKLIVSDPRGPPKDKSKLKNWDESKGRYENVSQVVEDIRQIWENTRKFNGPNHVVTLAAAKLEDAFEKGFRNMPPEPVASLPPPPSPAAASPAGPSTHARRPSISQAPAARRSSDGPDSSRPKREIHPPPSKDLGYHDGSVRKPKRRNDPQLQWTLKTLKSFETTQKHHAIVSPFLYPVEDIMAAIPVYADLIKKPIDLLKIKKRLEDGEYDDFQQADADIRLMVRNAQTFNPPTDPVYEFATALLQLWTEKIHNLPPKQELRDPSEDPLADDYIEEGSDEEDANQLYRLEEQLTTIQAQIADIRARRAQRKSRPAKKAKKAGRKQSISKGSPGLGSNGHGPVKKGRKSKDISYRDDDDADSDEDSGTITLAQKQELADKMGNTDAETLNKAILIIQQTTDLGSNNEDIELDIDSLPARTVLKLYNLVVRGGRKAPKNKNAPLKKTGRKATGGANRKYMNEEEEADRIRRMEQQLQNYDAGRSGQPAGGRGEFGYDEEGDDSSEEESSDED